jgi:hypothetical protein
MEASRSLAKILRPGLALFCGTISLLLLGSRPVSAQSELQILRDSLELRFADSMTFELEATAPESIDAIVLRYQVGLGGVRNRRIPAFEPGKRVLARHEEDLVRGQVPPASTLRWWWSLTLADGSEYESPIQEAIYLDERFAWQRLDSPELRIWWYDEDAAFARSVRDSAMSALDRLGELFGSSPDRRIEIVTYQNQADLRGALVDRGEAYESRLATLGARVADDILVLDAGTRSEERDEVLAHELSHIVLNLRLEEGYIDAPLWLDEGLAMYVEGPLETDEQAALDEALTGDKLISVRSLTSFPGDADQVILAYAQSRDLVDFLVEQGGTSGLRKLLDGIGSAELTPDQALQEVYGFDQLGLYQAYRESHGLAEAQLADSSTMPRKPAMDRRREEPARLPLPCASLGLLLPFLVLAARWLLKH